MLWDSSRCFGMLGDPYESSAMTKEADHGCSYKYFGIVKKISRDAQGCPKDADQGSLGDVFQYLG